MATVYDAATGEETFSVVGPYETPYLQCSGWNVERDRIAVIVGDEIQLWDTSNGELLLTMEAPGAANLWWSADGGHILSRSLEGEMLLWDASQEGEANEPLARVSGGIPQPLYFPPNWSFDGRLLVMWGASGQAQVWDMQTGALRASVTTPDGLIAGAALSPDVSRLVTWSNGNPTSGTQNFVRIWTPNSEQQVISIQEQIAIFRAEWTPDGESILSFTPAEGPLWDASTGAQLAVLPQAPLYGPMARPVWSHDGNSYLVGLYELQLWEILEADTPRRKILPLPLLYGGEVMVAAAWSADGTSVLYWTRANSGCRPCDSTLGVFDIVSGNHELLVTGRNYVGAMWNANETRELTWSWDGIDVWSVLP